MHHHTRLILLSLSFILIFPSALFAATTSACDAGIEKRIEEPLKKYYAQLSVLLKAEEKKSTLTEKSLQQLRALKCELDSICALAEDVYLRQDDTTQEGFQPLAYTQCYGSEKAKTFSKEDYIGEKAICSYSRDPQELARIRESCQAKISLKLENAKITMQSEFRLASKQDTGNYYSAKLLSIADRLQQMTDTLQMLNQKIREVFLSISCRCSKK